MTYIIARNEMSPGGIIALLVVVIIISIISLVYASRASTSLSDVSDYDKDQNFSSAHKLLVWISVIGWLTIIFLVFAAIASAEYGFATTFSYFAIFAAIVIIIATGVIAAIAANDIGSSAKYPASTDTSQDATNIRSAYEFAIISATTALGSFILAIIAAIALNRLSPRVTGTTPATRDLRSQITAR